MRHAKYLAMVLSLFVAGAAVIHAGTVVKSKSNISNNRMAAESCKGTVTRTDVGQEKGQLKPGSCSGECPKGVKCKWQKQTNQHGGTREWCGCSEVEPKDHCHIVLITPGKGEGGGAPYVQCSETGCEKPKTCKEKETVIGSTKGPNGVEKRVSITCDCQ